MTYRLDITKNIYKEIKNNNRVISYELMKDQHLSLLEQLPKSAEPEKY